MLYDNMKIYAFIECMLCIYFYNYAHKWMLSWFKIIKMIIFLFKRIFLIFHILMTFYENFIKLIYQENNLLRHKMNFLFIYNLKAFIYTKLSINV